MRVDLHCHSDESDGYYAPSAVAELLADERIAFAALTDHRSVAGLTRFHSAARARGVSGISGAELHVEFDGAELHLLAYGFDPESPAIADVLFGTPEAGRAIEAVHEAGGVVSLAHPLQAPWREAQLETEVGRLADLGLDAIEAYYQGYSPRRQQQLVELADRLGILVTGGSDFHGPVGDNGGHLGVDMPLARWRRFRAAVADRAENGMYGCVDREPEPDPARFDAGRLNWRWLLLRIVLPSVLVVAVFVGLIFAFLIPAMEERLMERKREMTTQLTNSAWSVLADYHREIEEGRLSTEEAQAAAVERIRRMRYGPDAKDYFWITDMHPNMVMHPYRQDLEGSDVSEFTDPDGVRPFVEFVEAVRHDEAGYVTYVWQWQDDPDRLEPKESYVRRFAPWGWIIGTGLYVDDVRGEIGTITGRMVDASFVVLLLVVLLLSVIAYQSLKAERRRSAAERELRRSHERYRALVEAAATGTLLLADGRCTYANRTMLELSGYTAAELALLDLRDLVETADHGTTDDQISCLVGGTEVREPFEARLRRRNGVTVPILISSTTVFFSGRQGLIVSIQDLTSHRAMQTDAARERLISQLQSSLLFLTKPVRSVMSDPACCLLDTPIAQVVRLMDRSATDAVAVMGPSDELVGIVTDHDIRKRVVGANLDPRQPVSRIMSAPVVTIDEHAPVFEASVLERERNVDRLAVTDGAGKLVGMMQSSSALRPERYSSFVLTQQIRRAQSVDELAELYLQLPALVRSLVETGAVPRNICHVTTTVSDGIAQRVVALTLERLGPAPGPFVFVALGSEAREEQTLATDQDNALIYASANGRAQETAEYFLHLGTEICDALDRIGYRHCRGDAMAKDSRWNQPLEQWRAYFDTWIGEPDGSALAHCNVFFDHRALYGDTALLRRLQEHIRAGVSCRPEFLSHLALSTLDYRPPVGAFGRIVTSSSGEAAHTFDIKEAMMPIVNFARLYALRYQIEHTNTFDRLDALAAAGHLSEENHRATVQAYALLMQLRFRHQLDLVAEGRPPDNLVDPRRLTPLELSALKNAFTQTVALQKKLTYAFRGTG